MSVWRVFVRNFSKKKKLTYCEILCDGPPCQGKPHVFKFLALAIALPVVIGLTIKSFLLEDHSEPYKPFVPYEYLGIRTKKFPWGDGNESFFHNPKKNRLPPYTIPYVDPLAGDYDECEDETGE